MYSYKRGITHDGQEVNVKSESNVYKIIFIIHNNSWSEI